MIHIAMPTVEIFGAGTCGKYLVSEFSRRTNVTVNAIPGDHGSTGEYLGADLDCPLLQFGGPELGQQTRYRGTPNVGYLFSEWEPITAKQKKNIGAFDRVAAGSTWNADVIRAAGVECAAVQQGVDCEIFAPCDRVYLKDKFVIYSGGQWAHRKAQDLVVRAVKVLQDRHDDIVLLASWFNIWENADHYDEAIRAGLKLVGLPLCSHEELAFHMNQSDVGLFPNRCEGGTNLILMEYMACGKPAIANTSTGQRDVVDDDYALCIRGSDNELVEQMIYGVDALYSSAERRGKMGSEARRAMLDWPWSRTADGLEGLMK